MRHTKSKLAIIGVLGLLAAAAAGYAAAFSGHVGHSAPIARQPGSPMGDSASGMMGGSGITSAPRQGREGGMMGRLGGARVTPGEAERLGGAAPPGALIERRARKIIFASRVVELWVLASPPSGPDMTFQAAGIPNPTIIV